MVMQENVPIGFDFILQDYCGEIQDYKQALNSYFDAFSLLLGNLLQYKNIRKNLISRKKFHSFS